MLGPGGRSVRRSGPWRAFIPMALLAVCGCGRSEAPAPQPAVPAAPSRLPPATDVRIRVRLAAEVDRLELAVDGPCELRDAGGAVLVSESGRLEPQALSRAAGSRGFRFREQTWPLDAVELVPAADGTLRLKLPGMNAFGEYPGTLRCYLTASGRIEVINELDIEEYLHSVVAGEMPGWFQPEALAAQAIAARTYALYLMRSPAAAGRTWDVKAGEGSQVYSGLARQQASSATAEAVDLTRGLVCVWDSPEGPKLFCTYYSAVCGGCTQPARNLGPDGDVPPLSGNVPCDFCAEAKYYRWGPEILSRTLIMKNLREHYERFGAMRRLEAIELLDPTPDGRPARVRVVDRNGRSGLLRAEDFRLAVDPSGRILRSTHFRVLFDGDDVVFYDGRGWGHGVGMCQWGAQGLARLGKTAMEILAYYYPDSRVEQAYR